MTTATPKNLHAALMSALETSFVDAAAESEERMRAGFLRNSADSGKVLHVIEEELRAATGFSAAVAFITKSGVAPLITALQELRKKNVPGRILTTDYLTFTEPAALRQLAAYPNLEVRLHRTAAGRGFHAKGWIFERDGDERRLVVGSSNWTQYALMKNDEWNVHLVTKKDGAFVRAMTEEFESLWNDPRTLTLDQVLGAYEAEWKALRKVRIEQRRLAKTWSGAETDEPAVPDPAAGPAPKLEPNAMQRHFIAELQRLRDAGESRALLVSATGTGKTYAAAFAAKGLVPTPKRILFLVHRGQIAKQAKLSFDRIFGDDDSGFLMGEEVKNRRAARIFATVQTMSGDAELGRWPADAFDLIIIDEVHRAAAPSYDKIFRHFRPAFWLGMSASPERGDGADVFALFDHNVACEVRLRDALELDLLCPFHYYGISDLVLDDGEGDGAAGAEGPAGGENTADADAADAADASKALKAKKQKRLADFAVSANRVDHILKAAREFGHGGERVKGLAFVSRNDEAELLAKAFRARGVPALAVSGAQSQEAREKAIQRLVRDDIPEEEKLSYLFSVDIFNEGVDIPEVNQLLLLRPTESPVVFVQQLGRGLRRSPEKDYLTVIDFIANYESNFLIPVALSGDRSYDKDAMRREVFTLNRRIPGCVSVHFDDIARERVLAAIDRAKTMDMKLLRDAWMNLRARLGRVPELCDFLEHESIDPVKFMEKSKSYEAFMTSGLRADARLTLRINGEGFSLLAYLSKRFGKGKRLPDVILLEKLFAGVTGGAGDSGDGAPVVDLRDVRAEVARAVGTLLAWTPLLSESLGRCVTGRFWTDEWALAESVVGGQGGQSASANLPVIAKEMSVEDPSAGRDAKNGKDAGAPKAPSDHFTRRPLLRLAPKVRALFLEPENADLGRAVAGLVRFMRRAWELRWREADLTDPTTGLVVGGKYTYEDACRFLGWATNVNAQVIGGYKFDAATRTLPVFVNYDKTADAIGYHDHFVSADHLVALSKTNRRPDSVDADHIFREAANEVHLFVRKNKDDSEAKAFYYLGRCRAEGDPVPVTVGGSPAFEINYRLAHPVRADLYSYLTEA